MTDEKRMELISLLPVQYINTPDGQPDDELVDAIVRFVDQQVADAVGEGRELEFAGNLDAMGGL